MSRCPVPHDKLHFDHYDYALQDDPYPVYARMRAEAPLYHNEEHDFWVLTRHADLHQAWRTDGVFSNRMGVSLDESAWNENAHLVMSFLALDPPEQTRLRKLVSRGFTPRRVAELEPRIQKLCDDYLDQALAKGEFDWITDVSGRLPMDVISELLGVPEEDRDEVRRLADLLVHREHGLRDVPPAGMAASMELLGYFERLLARKRVEPGDDLASALLTGPKSGPKSEAGMSDAELTAFLFLMVVAGNETTTKLLGNAVVNLTRHPDQLEAVFADESLVEPWIEETLRYDASSQLLGRHLVQDVTVDGVTAPADSRLMLCIGAANHDEAVFDRADEFDVRRDAAELSRHLAFGGGRHYCLGANLARLEARVVLTSLVRRCAHIEVDHDRAVRFYSANVRGFASVPMRVELR